MKNIVPQPASKGYSAAGDSQTVRDRLVDMYGDGTVTRAELATVIDVLIVTGMIKPQEFMDIMQKRLYHLDQQRRTAANLDSDRG
jgi:hypothetical protein